MENLKGRGDVAGVALGNIKTAWTPGNIGTGIGAGAAEGAANALAQFTPEALTARAVTAGLNFIAKGFTDLALSMLDGGASARAYTAALKLQKEEYAAAIAQFQHDDLAAALAQVAVAADQLRKQLQDSVTVESILHGGSGGIQQSKADIAAAEAKNIRMIQDQQRYALEDLQIRNLRATGQGDQADLLAFQEKQAREMQAALDANKDAVYINNLRTTENNELLAFQNGLLSTAMRNNPTGFYADVYYQQYATPRTSLGGGVNGGGADNSNGGLTPSGSRSLALYLMLDGKVVAKSFVSNLDAKASSTGGSGTSRAQALELM